MVQANSPQLPVTVGLGVAAGLLVLVLRQGGILQGLELAAYDRLVQLRPDQGSDNRIVVIGISEDDLKRFSFPIPDRLLDQALGRLESAKPAVIALDLYRDKPQEPLATRLRQTDTIIAVTKIGDAKNPGVAGPPGMNPELIAASDVPLDEGGVVRRSLIYATVKSQPVYSLSFVTAAYYLLTQKQVQLNKSPLNPDYLMLGQAVLVPLDANAGGYQNNDARGYQTLINYRSPKPFVQYTLAQLIDKQIPARDLKNKIIYIGQTAPSVKDLFFTPFGQAEDKKMPGVVIQAQITSQLLDSAEGNRPLLWFWPDSLEMAWIALWGLIGSLGIGLMRPWLGRVAVGVGSVFLIVGMGYVLFLNGGWIPVVPPLLALGIGLMAVLIPAPKVQPAMVQPVTLEPALPAEATVVDPEQTIRATRSGMSSSNANTVLSGRGGEVQLGTCIDPKNRYRIETRLGGGGMGDVYLTLDTVLGKQVALKVLKGAIGDKPGFRQRFEREVAIAAALSGDHIVQVSDYGLTKDGYPFYVMEYLRGQSLGQVLKREQRLTISRALIIASQVCAGLSPAHRGVTLLNDQGSQSEPIRVVHRDLKPDNIFLLPTAIGELVKILDFGIVKLLDQEEDRTNLTATGQFLGTSRYAAPEQWQEKDDLDSRADIYALGVILYEMLTGTNPFNLPADKTSMGAWYEGHVFKEAQPLRAQPDCDHIPLALEVIVLKCLAKVPSERYDSVDTLNLALKQVVI